jgi:capsular exopolysaccharide synthesis family protein
MQQVNLKKMIDLDFRSSEAYKTLRTNIQFCGNNVRVICLTSCMPNEGKSNVSFNLAVSFAESGKRVIFIDADLRRSTIISRYRPDQAVLGLTHYLSGQNDLDTIIYETNVPNLDIIFTGPTPPNPSELLDNEYLKSLLLLMREEYDYVFVDTPPLGSVIDSAIVANNCDGLILVIESNAISYKLAQKVKKQLVQGNIRLLGAVLNKVNLKSLQYISYNRKYKKYEKKYYGSV